MKRLKRIATYLVCLTILNSYGNVTSQNKTFSLNRELNNTTHIKGKPDDGAFLYVTAGNTLYSIGSQNGKFPEVGFHVQGEMGGVWHHPIKLLDGFSLKINTSHDDLQFSLADSKLFTAYPFANQFRYQSPLQELAIVRTDFVPDDLPVLIVEYAISNLGDTKKTIDLNFEVDTDLSPVWLGSRTGMQDGTDQLVQNHSNLALVKDSLNTWYVGVTSSLPLTDIQQDTKRDYKGQGTSISLHTNSITLAPNETKTVHYYIGGSSISRDEVSENLTNLQLRNCVRDLFVAKKERYNEIDNRARITVPDTLLMKAYQWGKYNTDWLKRDIKGMGRGINAGLPDYPWFFSNDQAYTFNGLVGTMKPDLFYDSWDMMLRISNAFNKYSGRIIHEVSTNGAVYSKGRMEESQEFINTAWEIFKWTGNKEFLSKYYAHGKLVWKFLQANDKDNNLYVEGYGGTEIKGLNDEMLDVAVSTQAFLDVMSQMATIFHETEQAVDYSIKARTLKENINRDWWSASEHRFYDFRSDKEKAVQLIDNALKGRVKPERNMWAKKKLETLKASILDGSHSESGYNVFYNANTSVLTKGIADADKAVAMLDSVSFFTNKFGLYVSGIARPDDITLEEGSVADRLKGKFNYHEAIMTIGTSGLAIAESKYRGSDYALKYIHQILNNFSFATPGTSYEVSPDYGMFVQAWNVSGINIPLIHHFFGVSPMAHLREINIHPDMPKSWEFAKLKNLLIGNNDLSIDYKKKAGVMSYHITSSEAGWTINFELPTSVKSVKVNGKKADHTTQTIQLTGKSNNIEIE